MYSHTIVQFQFALWLAVLLVVGGCANRNLVAPTSSFQTPAEFSESGQFPPPNRWWTAFDIPELDFQINQAMVSNNTLAAAFERIQAARALTRREAADLWPNLDGVADIGGNAGPGDDRASFELGLETFYQVDLWGRIGARVDAESLRADATDADYHAVALALAAEVAANWFALIEANAQVKLLDQQIKTNGTGLQLQESRFAEGLIRSPDVLRQRQLLESTREQSTVVKSRIEVLEHRLAVLLGQSPQAASFDPGSTLPELPPLPETGLPCELLDRRPDVRRDFLAFQAADRDLASAISAQFPRLNLTGSLINATEDSGTFLKDWFVSMGSQLIAPILNGGRLRAEVDRNSAIVYLRFYEYSETVLNAFREVEDSLAQEKYQLKRIGHLEEQVKLASQSTEQLREQYLIQEIGYLDVLSAIQAEQGLQRRLLAAQLELVLFRVSLYLALAGDFEVESDVLINPVEPVSDSLSAPEDPTDPKTLDANGESPPETETNE